MNPEDFSKLAEVFSEALVLLSGDGHILAANRLAKEALGWSRKNQSSDVVTLAQQIGGDGDVTTEFLRACRRSREDVVGALRLNGKQSPTRVFGRLLSRGDEPSQSTILLRIASEDDPINRFTILNAKIEELSREISRRRSLEKEIRKQRDLATFGRDIGHALATNQDLSITLQKCVELMVEHLDVSFARIWITNPSGTELQLQASAGLYTHLDGAHSRIQVGQFKIGMIAQHCKPHLTNNVIGDEQVHDQEWAKRENLVAFAGYPLVVDQRTTGVMAVFARHELSTSTLVAMESVANSIAMAVIRKQADEMLEQQARALKLADQRKDEFLAMLAHELRNPLAPIRSGLELLQIESGQSETLKLMEEQVRHMTCLVDDLLDVSRIMRGRIGLRTDLLRMDEVINHAVQTVKNTIEARHHSLTVRQCESPVWLSADRVRLGQIVTNLLTNAAKYTPDGGLIQLETTIDASHVTLRVRDNGIGIEPDFLPDVFELFAQAERGLARSDGGLGIGLTLVSRLVALHGGEVDVTSEGAGAGSEFIVRLPLAESPDEPSAHTGLPVFEMPTDCRILVVDDSVGSAKILRSLLQAIGGRNIALAHDGLEAVSAAKEFRPNIIFLDIGLPTLSGFEVAERLRADDRFESTELIALTGYGTAEDRNKSRDVGFDYHLVKPVSLDQLKEAIMSGRRFRVFPEK